MTTPDSFGSGGATGSGSGGLAAGPGDDQGESAVTTEAETGRPESAHDRPAENRSAAPGTSGGLGEAGGTGPDLSEDDEETAADGGVHQAGSAER